MVVMEKLILLLMEQLQFITLVVEVDIEHLALHLQVDKVVVVEHQEEMVNKVQQIKVEDQVVVTHQMKLEEKVL